MRERIRGIRTTLNRSVFVGERLERNMRNIRATSLIVIALGLVMTALNLAQGQYVTAMSPLIILISGVISFVAVDRYRRRDIAVHNTMFAVILVLTCDVLFLENGFAFLWTLMVPLAICYMCSVKMGVRISVYFELLFVLLFYTPLRRFVEGHYTKVVMDRFPLLYFFNALLCLYVMYQYHRSVLFEIEYEDKLHEEVARQTAVAEERSRRIEQMSFQTIQTLAQAIDAKDPYTKGHSSRVSQHAVMIAQALGWEEERVNELRYAALLHDIGKIGVPDSILNKPSRLTEVEYDIVKSHTTMGGDILKDRTAIGPAEDVARSHHERYDGTGYPAGLKGEEISEEARIVAIADAFDAMNSNRIYRKACDAPHIRRELLDGRGKQFDPKFADVLIALWDQGVLEMESEEERREEDGDVEASSALLQEVMEAFMSQSAAENTDVTTGVLNRAAGEAAIARSMKEDSGCFGFFDVDNLKIVNDTNGHKAGDRVLRYVGEALMEGEGERICCRLGGDEFLAFLKQASREEAESAVRAILAAFAAKKNADPETAAATLSAGLVMCSPADAYMKVYNKADKALYHVKQNGKNSYGFYNEDSESYRSLQVDVNKLVDGIHSSGKYDGAMDVEYRQFARLYEYITNLKKRFAHPFKLILITLESADGEPPTPEELEKAMFYMEQAIRQTIRNVDVTTRYTGQQFLVILLGTDEEGVKIALDRILRGYYKMNGSGSFTPTYSVAELDEA